MAKERIITIPNILTAFRLFLIPLFIISMSKKDYSLAMKILILGGITDYLDGVFARKLNQISKFGIFFDPFVDKILTLSIIITFYINHLVPSWFIFIIFTRDILVSVGWLETYLRRKKLIKPLLLGKISNATQVIIFSYVLFAINFNLPQPSPFFYILGSSIAIISLVQYFLKKCSNNETKRT